MSDVISGRIVYVNLTKWPSEMHERKRTTGARNLDESNFTRSIDHARCVLAHRRLGVFFFFFLAFFERERSSFRLEAPEIAKISKQTSPRFVGGTVLDINSIRIANPREILEASTTIIIESRCLCSSRRYARWSMINNPKESSKIEKHSSISLPGSYTFGRLH